MYPSEPFPHFVDDYLAYLHEVFPSQASLDGTFSQLRAGESTVIDTLNTEADLLNDQTALIRAQQLYLSALARLRFESGQLVTFSGLGEPAETLRFVPTDFVVR